MRALRQDVCGLEEVKIEAFPVLEVPFHKILGTTFLIHSINVYLLIRLRHAAMQNPAACQLDVGCHREPGALSISSSNGNQLAQRQTTFQAIAGLN